MTTIIPYYRQGTVLERAVESVLKQTLRPDEIIIVDDGNPGQDQIILRSLQNRRLPVQLKMIHSATNQGPGRARNLGWSAATGDYVFFLDADDIWHPCKLELQLNWLRRHPDVHMLCGGTAFIDDLSGITHDQKSPRFFQLRPIDLLLHNPVSTRTVVFRRDFDLRFAEHKKNSEDYELYLTAALRGYNLFYCDATLAYCFKADYGEGGLSAKLSAAHGGHVDTLQRVKAQGWITPGQYLVLRMLAQLKHCRRLLFVWLGINRSNRPLGVSLKKFIPFFRFRRSR